jgi:hypothetical protein
MGFSAVTLRHSNLYSSSLLAQSITVAENDSSAFSLPSWATSAALKI